MLRKFTILILFLFFSSCFGQSLCEMIYRDTPSKIAEKCGARRSANIFGRQCYKYKCVKAGECYENKECNN